MLDTRIGRFGGFLIGVALIVSALVLTTRRHIETTSISPKLDPRQTREVCQERVREARQFMRPEPFEVNGR